MARYGPECFVEMGEIIEPDGKAHVGYGAGGLQQPPGLINAVFIHKISERQVGHALEIAAKCRNGQAGKVK